MKAAGNRFEIRTGCLQKINNARNVLCVFSLDVIYVFRKYILYLFSKCSVGEAGNFHYNK
jgi:hypothetical protein